MAIIVSSSGVLKGPTSVASPVSGSRVYRFVPVLAYTVPSVGSVAISVHVSSLELGVEVPTWFVSPVATSTAKKARESLLMA